MALTAPQRFVNWVGGVLAQVVPTLVGGAAAAFQIPALGPTGQLDPSMMPTGVGADIQFMPATESLGAGAWINIWTNGGVTSARNADGSAANAGKPVNGFVLAAVAQGAQAAVYMDGLNTAVTGQSQGPVYLSDVNPGQGAAASPTIAGHTAQLIGDAVSATAVHFRRGLPIILA